MRRWVDRHRLFEAASVSGRTVEDLATEAGIAPSSLTRFKNGGIRSANPATLARLAAALRVSEAWLTGDTEDLPHVSGISLLEGKRIPRPTAEMVRLSWLLQQVERALRRDLERWYGAEAGIAYDSWGRGVLLAVDELASAVAWRLAGVTTLGHPIVYIRERNVPNKPTRFPDRTVAITWVEQMLEPWFADVATLNARTLSAVLRALFANPAREPYGILDDDALRGLGMYDATSAASPALERVGQRKRGTTKRTRRP